MLDWLFPVYSSCIFCKREDVSSIECGICADCLKTAPFTKDVSATFYYDVKTEGLSQDLKYNGRRYLAVIFADLSRDKLSNIHYDIICFVPTRNKKKRGYNQAELIARAIDDEKTVDALVKIKDTPSQTALSREERMKNVKGCYRVSNPQEIDGKAVLLVDDVYTTGSTVKECRRMLLEAGAELVEIYTICKTKQEKS